MFKVNNYSKTYFPVLIAYPPWRSRCSVRVVMGSMPGRVKTKTELSCQFAKVVQKSWWDIHVATSNILVQKTGVFFVFVLIDENAIRIPFLLVLVLLHVPPILNNSTNANTTTTTITEQCQCLPRCTYFI